jgi:hypothetical protein
MKGLCSLLLLFILASALLLIYIKSISIEKFGITLPHIETHPIKFTYNVDNSRVVKVLDNIIIDGRYLNVYQCRPLSITTDTINTNAVVIYNPLGQYIKITDTTLDKLEVEELKLPVLSLLASGGVSPSDYLLVWSSKYLAKQPKQDFSIWRPIAPIGYQSLCDVVVMGFSKPTPVTSNVVCLPQSILESSPVLKDVMLSVDYNAFDIDYKLHCWNVSSHQFFRCSSTSNSSVKAETNDDDSLPLVTNEQNIKESIYNIKNENILAGGSSIPSSMTATTPTTPTIHNTRFKMST